jgi:phage replication O-like protein O
MAAPQTKNGFTKIPNELLEALGRTRIPGEARQIFDVILRKTYGFNKAEDYISLSQLCLATGLSKSSVCRGLLKLQEMNLIVKNVNGPAYMRRINRDISSWMPLSKKNTVSKKVNPRCPKSKSALSKKRHTKETLSKENSTKEKLFADNSDEFRLAELLFSLIRGNDSKAKEPNMQSWARHVDKMIRLDNRTPEEIEAVIYWSQKDSFWKSNILSTGKLRERFPTLNIQMQGGRNRNGNAARSSRSFKLAGDGSKFNGR